MGIPLNGYGVRRRCRAGLLRERGINFVKKKRNTDMSKLGFTLTFLTVVACSLFPGGCDRREEQQGLEAALKSELAAVIQERDRLQEQVGKLAKDWAAKEKTAQVTMNNLKNLLAEETEKVVELQDRNEKLQATIDELQKKLGIEAEEVKDEFKEIREPDVIFVPTPQDVVDKMLELAEVTKDDLVYDLGCQEVRLQGKRLRHRPEPREGVAEKRGREQCWTPGYN
jgi:hypothetical protein